MAQQYYNVVRNWDIFQLSFKIFLIWREGKKNVINEIKLVS